MKKMLKMTLFCVVTAVAFTLWWSSLSESKKRYFKHVGQQVPWMPFRYFA
ncbi:MAG: hypothetical protein ACYC99_16020 [Candidatus Geothermincolia bacterium]